MNEIRRYAGIRAGTEFPESHVTAAAQEILTIAEPKGCYEFFDYDSFRGAILDKQGSPILDLEGSAIQNHLAKAERVVLMAVTIGELVENIIAEHFKNGEYAQGLLLDAAATTAVEIIADQLDMYIQELGAKQGGRTLWRFSPGYGNWPLEQQGVFAKLLELGNIWVTVTSQSILSPRKSVTAIIGIVSGEKNKAKHNTSCYACTKVDCEARKE